MDKELEKLVEQWLKHTPLEEPSEDFTNKVMDKIEALKEEKKIVYKPILPKGFLAFVLLLIIGGVVFVFNKEPLIHPEFTPKLNFDFIKVGVSSTLIYASGFLAIMFLVQVVFLKSYFNKRLN